MAPDSVTVGPLDCVQLYVKGSISGSLLSVPSRINHASLSLKLLVRPGMRCRGLVHVRDYDRDVIGGTRQTIAHGQREGERLPCRANKGSSAGGEGGAGTRTARLLALWLGPNYQIRDSCGPVEALRAIEHDWAPFLYRLIQPGVGYWQMVRVLSR